MVSSRYSEELPPHHWYSLWALELGCESLLQVVPSAPGYYSRALYCCYRREEIGEAVPDRGWWHLEGRQGT